MVCHHPLNVFRHLTRLQTICSVLLLASLTAAEQACARTSNGNDFALYVSEQAPGSEARKALVNEALNRPHAFRYLQIMDLTGDTADGQAVVHLTCFEPASLMDVKFTVEKPVSLKLLKDAPESKRGDAIAVTGRLDAVDDKENSITLSDVIIRHKDRLSPAVGRELLCEVAPGATFYTYSGGKRAVSLTFEDRDLLQHKDRVLAAGGKQAWADFLEKNLAERNAARAKARKASKSEASP